MKDDRYFLELSCESAARIGRHISGLDYEHFLADEKTQDATVMQLQVMGELAKRVSKDTQKSIDLNWKNMAGMRDVISHEYDIIDLDIVWKTANENVPEVFQKVAAFLGK